MALSTVVRHSFDSGSVTIADGTPTTPLSATVQFDNADFAASGLMPGQRPGVVYQGRGAIRSVRPGEYVPPTISFTAMVTQMTEDSAGTAYDLIMGTGPVSYIARVGTRGTADVPTFDVTFTTVDTVMEFEDVELACDFAQGGPNTLSFSGTVYGAYTVTVS